MILPPTLFSSTGEAALKMDTTALPDDRLIEVDTRYREEIALKRDILASDARYYSRFPESTLPLQWEALELLTSTMVRHHPEAFTLEPDGERIIWTNRLLDTRVSYTPGDAASLPGLPLDWLGRQVQEDLLLMSERDDGEIVLAGGQLCFAAKWSLDDKMGLPFLEIHDPVPGFRERIGQKAELLMRRLKPGRPVGRVNWSIAPTDRLNLSPTTAHEWQPAYQEITPENAGERCCIRLERQTLSRLPQTRGILFTIHTILTPLGKIAQEPDTFNRMANTIRSLPDEMAAYKGIALYKQALMEYLDRVDLHAHQDSV